MLTNMEIARLEEAREAAGSADALLRGRERDPACAHHAAEKNGTGWMMFGGTKSWWTQAVGMGMDGAVSDDDLDRLVTFFASRGAVPRVAVASYAHPSLMAGLVARGFVAREWVHIYARQLAPAEDLWASWPHARPEGHGPESHGPESYEIERVNPADEHAIREYADVASSGFRPAGTPMTEDMLHFNRQVLQHPPCQGFAVRIQGQVVAAGAMEAHEQIVSLFGASVLPAYRRRGLQAALMVARMEAGRARGCRLATIHGQPGVATERNAGRLGFSMAYAKLVMERTDISGL